ncbi:MAG: response regulator transcription factor [Verrucomicrobiales bacterium]|jgi:DNA-binding NarL/FixJ family response regulator|nr:response regulator transcription factor [Verrucomicrobiales bacterium]
MLKKVVMVEDDDGLRGELKKILAGAADIQCLGAFPTGEAAFSAILRNPPDVVLMDIKLPGMCGIECAAKLKRNLPGIEIVMLTVCADAEKIFDALKAGASGYLLKSSPPRQILHAIRDVYGGGAPFSSHIARKITQHFQAPPRESAPHRKLSPRESEILELLVTGCLYKEVADRLGISIDTVREHVERICRKLHARNRTEAIAKHLGG